MPRTAAGLKIAERLVLSEKAVGHHVSAVLQKLGVRTRGQASARAARLGLAGQDRLPLSFNLGDPGAPLLGYWKHFRKRRRSRVLIPRALAASAFCTSG